MDNFKLYYLLFIIYSFMGWLIETICCSIEERKLVSRGFLIGPICTIYGFGAITMLLFLDKYLDSPIILFVMGTFICSVLEYITSFVMEKLFNTRWWDYSKRMFNINGRVCLTNAFGFGILGVALLYFINPFFLNVISKIPTNILNVSFYILIILFTIDYIISLYTISKFTKTAKLIKKDSCDEINKKVREEIEKGKNVLRKRLIKAFPNFKILDKIKDKK